MHGRFQTVVSLLAFALASPALAQGMFDPRSANQSAEPAVPASGNVEGAPASPLASPVITNRLSTRNTPGALEPSPQRQWPEARERIEFQDFVLQSLGRDLPIFGSNLFRQAPSTFAPVDNIPVTPDYVIGPGDEIMIRAWGQIDVDFSATVDRNGTISVPKVGVINVAGIKYQDLPAYLKTTFGRVFRNFELTASLGRLRSIQIFVVGQARRPGTYTVSSLSTLVTALFAVGGPSSTGSMRSIQLKRGNQIVADLDLYDLLVSGDKSKDAPLLPGDVIYIPPVGPLVAVSGSVNVPAIYELRQNAPIFEVLRWAGGLSTTAQGQKVTLERIQDRKERKVEEFPLDYSGLARPVRDGDLLTVYSLTPRFDNEVALRGDVAQPGRFPWREGMRIRDIIPDKEALLSRDYWLKRNQAVGIESNVAKLLTQQESAGTRLGVTDLAKKGAPSPENASSIGDAIHRRQIESEAGKLADAPPAKLINEITPSLKEVNWGYALIERIKRDDLTTTLIPFNLGKAILDGDPGQNILLQPGDIITIFSKEDLQVPVTEQTKFVRLEGEFNAAGVYQALPGETLRQLVVRVGGLAPNAYLFGSEFTRESTRQLQEQRFEEAVNRLEQDMQRQAASRAQSTLSAEDAAQTKAVLESQQALVAKLKTLHPTGRIVLEVPENARVADLPDLALENGDRLYVPPRSAMVSVFGAVYNQNAFVYRSDKRFSDYLALAGGPTRDADRGSLYLIRPDGSIVSKRQEGLLTASLEGMRLAPGDTIVVPEEFDKTTFTRALKDWTQILYQFGLGAAAVRVLSR